MKLRNCQVIIYFIYKNIYNIELLLSLFTIVSNNCIENIYSNCICEFYVWKCLVRRNTSSPWHMSSLLPSLWSTCCFSISRQRCLWLSWECPASLSVGLFPVPLHCPVCRDFLCENTVMAGISDSYSQYERAEKCEMKAYMKCLHYMESLWPFLLVSRTVFVAGLPSHFATLNTDNYPIVLGPVSGFPILKWGQQTWFWKERERDRVRERGRETKREIERGRETVKSERVRERDKESDREERDSKRVRER